MMGRPYTAEGEILHGNAIGRTIGFATLNMELPEGKHVPRRGVYFSRTRLDGRDYAGITNIGLRPTIEGKYPNSGLLLETHLLQYNRFCYGKTARVSLLHYHREEQRFDGLSQLKDQLETDRRDCETYMSCRDR